MNLFKQMSHEVCEDPLSIAQFINKNCRVFADVIFAFIMCTNGFSNHSFDIHENDMMDLFLVFLIIFVAFLVRATFGFGDALVAMPLLTMLVGISLAAPLMAMLALVIAFMIFFRNRREVNFKMAGKLAFAALFGIPVGLIYLKNTDENVINLFLGIIIVVFVVFKWGKFVIFKQQHRIITYIAGFTGGMLGAAYNTSAPPVIMLLTTKNYQPAEFRATLQAFFMFSGIGVVAGHIISGNIDQKVLTYFMGGLPLVFVSVFIGEWLQQKFDTRKFYAWIYALLALLGLTLFFKVILG